MKVSWSWRAPAPTIEQLTIEYQKKSILCLGTIGPGCGKKYLNLGAYSKTSHIFKGIDDSKGGLLQEKTYKFRIQSTVNVGGSSIVIWSNTLQAKTLPALDINAPKVTNADGSTVTPTPQNLSEFRWKKGVFTSAQVSLEATNWGSENKSRYKFAFVVPKDTGIQIATGVSGHHPECNWGSWPTTTSAWTSWGSHILLVRCGIGTGSASITVKARNTKHDNYEWDTGIRIPIKQSWHHADNVASYQVDCVDPPTADLDFAEGIRKAAVAWNNANTGVTFNKLPQKGCDLANRAGKLTVSVGAGTCDSNDLACFQLSSARGYPHLDVALDIFINPTLRSGNTWSTKTNAIDRFTEYYLPTTMIHEFGHAAGLGHSANTSDLMRAIGRRGVIINAPSADDIKAMKAIYKSHTAH